MSASSKTDVAIIGAGPVGMALACELHRHGLRVRILDKEERTKAYSRAPVFWPRAQEALDLMGIHHLWDGQTAPMNRVHVSVYGVPAGTVALDAGESAHPVPMLVGQDVTERILDGHLAKLGVVVERASEAIAVERRKTDFRLVLKRRDGAEETIEADWVVGCDGGNSFVRQSFDFGWDGHPLEGLMVPICDAKVRWTLPSGIGEAFVALTDRGYMLTIPLPGFQRIIVAVPDTTPAGEQPSITLPQMAELTAATIGGPVELSDAPWVAVVRYGNHIARTFRDGNAFIVGDAAHSIAPLSGQGMNTGVQDAFDLGWKLAYVHKGWAPDGLLDSFTADRRPVAERLVHSTDRFFKIVNEPGEMQKRIMRKVAPAAIGFGTIREMFAEFYTELDVAYAQSPLSDDHRVASPKPGEHVLDGMLARWPDCAPMRLYDALRGLHWTAIVLAGSQASRDTLETMSTRLADWTRMLGPDRLKSLLVIGAPKPPQDFVPAEDGPACAIDAWQGLHRGYGAESGALLLIRPDGYVSLHRGVSSVDFDAAKALLHRVFGL